MPKRLYRGDYRRRAKAVTDAAWADPATLCRRCGLTLAQEQALNPSKRVTWDAGHVVDGDPRSPLAAEHSTCNRLAGAREGNRRMRANRERAALNPSRRWH